MPGIPGCRLVLGRSGAECRQDNCLPETSPDSKWLALLQRLSLTQYGVDIHQALREASVSLDSIQAIYSPFSDFLFALPQVPQVITCHDLTPLFYSSSRNAALKYRYLIPRHLKRATLIIAISHFVADQLTNIGVPSSKIEVVYNGIDVMRSRINRPRSLDLVMVARHDYNKNVLSVLRRFKYLLEKTPDWPGRLILIGKKGRQTPEILKYLASLNITDQIILKSSVTQSELLSFYRDSLALVSASLMEGFDYPIMEAKAEGLPTIISNIPAHQEIHASSSLFFELNHSHDEFIDAVQKLATLNSIWNDLSIAGYDLANALTLNRQNYKIASLLKKV